MKSTTASLAIMALASTVIAQPHAHHHHPARAEHQHRHQDQKRVLVTDWEVVWVTETVTEFIEASTTLDLYPTSSASTPATTLATVTTSPTPGDFLEKTSSPPSSTPVAVETTSSTSALSSAYVAPPAPATTISTSDVYVAPEIATSSTPVDTPTPAPAVEAPTTAASSPAAAATSSSSESGGSASVKTDITAVLGSGYSTGDMTFYTLGLGACGESDLNQDETANIVAMSADTMGTQSNGNPMCGKTIKIYHNGTTATGTIRDKCPGCVAGSIDVSKKLFKELAKVDDGRVQVSWNWV